MMDHRPRQYGPLAAIPAILGAIGAGIGVTGAGVTAAASIAAGAAVVGAGAAIGAQAIGGSQQAAAQKKAQKASDASMAAAQVLTPATTVGDASKGDPTLLGRAALISTSPQGVLGTDPTGRKKLLGN